MTTPLMLNAIVGAALAGLAPIKDNKSPPASNDEIIDFLETDMPYSIQKVNLGTPQYLSTLSSLHLWAWINTL
jgi:hypothetical protein